MWAHFNAHESFTRAVCGFHFIPEDFKFGLDATWNATLSLPPIEA